MSTAAGGGLGARVMEVELAIRSEWVKLHHREPLLSLSDVITIVARNNSLWPMAYEFRNPINRIVTQ